MAVASAAAVGSIARAASAEDAFSLRRVLLSTGGVGYFEYEATVDGDAALPLSVRLDQMDDVLKSVVVFDDRGSVGDIVFPGQPTLAEAFRDLPFPPKALGSEPALLNALRGAAVRIVTAGGEIHGRILSVTAEPVKLPEGGGVVTRHRLSVAADGRLVSVILEEVDSLVFDDPSLKAEIDAALQSLLDVGGRGRRTLTVHAAGKGERNVRVGYVTSAPLWKSTYRLTLPADPKENKAALTGFAVLENRTGEDWRDVDLTLVSGEPVTFRQALYRSYYVDRPEIPVEVAGRVLPRLEGGAVSIGDEHRRAGRGFMGMVPPAAPAPGPAAGEAAKEEAPSAPAAVTPAESSEAAAQVIFHVPMAFTLGASEDALVPIIDRKVTATQVSLYQPDVNAIHPLTSVEIQNEGDTALPPGVMAVFSSGPSVSYLGDARLATLPPGERRLVSFGVDQAVRVDRRTESGQVVVLAKIVSGVLELTRKERARSRYTIAGAARAPRIVILEEPRIPGFDLSEPAGGAAEATSTHYRIRVDVPAGATVPVTVTLERPLTERVSIADLSTAALEAYASSGEIPAAVREALGRVAALRAAVDDKETALSAALAQIGAITADQARIRDNLKAVPQGTPLAQRYLSTLAEQEDRLAALGKDRAAAEAALAAAKKALADALRAL